jgi:LysM repeat protein
VKSGTSALVALLLLVAVVATAVAGGLALGVIPPLSGGATPSPTSSPTLVAPATATPSASASPTDTPSPTPEPSPSASPTSGASPTPGGIHVVQEGEYLSTIAELYGVPWTAIAEANGLQDPYTIYPGQELIIPAPGASPSADPCALVYIVQAGDTFFDIAYELGVSPTDLEVANPHITDLDDLKAGDRLNVPRGPDCPSPSPSESPSTAP